MSAYIPNDGEWLNIPDQQVSEHTETPNPNDSRVAMAEDNLASRQQSFSSNTTLTEKPPISSLPFHPLSSARAAPQPDAAEQSFTSAFLTNTKKNAKKNYIKLSPFQEFYYEYPHAGYAFHKLSQMFLQLDSFLNVEEAGKNQDPWVYFLDIRTHVAYCSAIRLLTEALYRCRNIYHEPALIEKVRAGDNVRIRKEMLARLEKAEVEVKYWHDEAFERLLDRSRVLDELLDNVAKERERKLRMLDKGIDLKDGEQIGEGEQRSTLLMRVDVVRNVRSKEELQKIVEAIQDAAYEQHAVSSSKNYLQTIITQHESWEMMVNIGDRFAMNRDRTILVHIAGQRSEAKRGEMERRMVDKLEELDESSEAVRICLD